LADIEWQVPSHKELLILELGGGGKGTWCSGLHLLLKYYNDLLFPFKSKVHFSPFLIAVPIHSTVFST
jgi:hypothetical protein